LEREEARTEGRKEGWDKGREDGLEEGKTKSIEQMLSKGRTPEAIADFCGYDLEEVRKVAENMSSPA
jgi:predicted transposase YdaD